MGKKYTCKSCNWTGNRLPIEGDHQVCGGCGAGFDSKVISVIETLGPSDIPLGSPATLKKEFAASDVEVKGGLFGYDQAARYLFVSDLIELWVTLDMVDVEYLANLQAAEGAVQGVDVVQKSDVKEQSGSTSTGGKTQTEAVQDAAALTARDVRFDEVDNYPDVSQDKTDTSTRPDRKERGK